MLALLALSSAAWLPHHYSPRQRHAAPRMQQADYDQATFNPEISGFAPQGQQFGGEGQRPDGAHGTGNRFMPIATCANEPSPAIVCIAGAYPGITADQLRAPSPLPFAEPGGWNYHMLQPGAAPGGFVAIPGSVLLEASPDSIAVICSSPALGLEFPDGQEHEVIAIVDRSDPATVDRNQYNSNKFYALADPQGFVHLRWLDPLPADWQVVGKIVFCQLPFTQKPGRSRGFAEAEDGFEF